MCGFAGFLGLPVAPADAPALLKRMGDTLAHRGPDDDGIWLDAEPGIGLAHRRLSIQDVSPLGAQPMASRSGRYVMAYNGEVYNFPELRQELSARGHGFRGGSDTEVMLAAIEEWGIESAVPRFIGMFAFAVWDRQERCLWLCRDRLGIKPLYVGHVGRHLVFGSELKSLRIVPGFDRTVNRDALALYMRHDYVPAPLSIYASAGKVEPGTMVRYTPQPGGRPREHRHVWWSVEQAVAAPVAVPDGDAAVVEQLDALLRESIRGRLIADVPVGVLLSGGIDSSTVTGIAQSLVRDRLKTFTIGFTEQAFDEAANARAIARHLGTDHTDLYITADDALQVVPSLSQTYDEPFGDSSQIPTILVSRLAREAVTVALSGDGGDELFYGYGRYWTADAVWKKLSRVPAAIRGPVSRAVLATPAEVLNALFPRASLRFGAYGGKGSPSQRLKRLATLAGKPDWFRFYRGIVSRWNEQDEFVLGGSDERHLLVNPPRWMRELPAGQYMMLADLQTYLIDDILAKVDRASMSTGLELREPVIDHRVVSYALALPLDLKYRDGVSKWVLRQVAYRYIPPALLDHPKQGFEIPIGAWLRGPLRDWAESLLDIRRLTADGYLNPDPVRERWDEHLVSRVDWQAHLWNVLMFQSWLDQERTEMAAPDSGPAELLPDSSPTSPLPVISPAVADDARPLRVLHAIHSLSGGGAETQLRLLVNSWPHADVELGVFFVAGEAAGITNPAVRLFASRRQSTKSPGFFLSVIQAIRVFDPDVIHIWLPESISIPAMLFGRLTGRRIIVSYRGRRTLERWLTWIEVALMALCADRVVSNHEVLAASSYQGSVFRWLFARKRGEVIRNGAAAPADLPDAAGEGAGPAGQAGAPGLPGLPPFRFICVGRLTPHKNYPRLMEALALLRGRTDWDLSIWGEGEDRVRVEAAIGQAGLAGRVHLRGYSGEACREIAAASALVLPSLSEGMPNVLVEAMALGVPVIASDIEGIREVVGKQPACLWINPLDPADIARGLSDFMEGRFDAADSARRGRRIAGRYSVPTAQAAWRKVYLGLKRAR